MPIIEMPDGTELEFPEGMDRGKMREAIRSKYSSGNETGGDELIATAGTGAPDAIPAESPPTKRQLLDAGIKESQKQSKYYTGKANALDFAERALDVPGAFKSLINLPNRLTGQPDYPALVSPEQVQKVGEFLNPLAPGALPQDEVTQGLLKGGAQTVSGLTSPDVAAAALLAKKYPVPVSTLFAGETLGAIPEATRSLLESKTPGEAAERAVPTAANLLLTKLLANHLIGKGPVIPKTGPPTDIPSEAAPAVEAAEPAPPAPPASVTTATLDRLEAEGKTPNEIQKEGVGSQVAGEISKSIEAVREAQPEGEIPGPVALADESKVVPLKSESEAPLAQQPFPAGPELLERALPGTDPFKSFSDALKAWKLSVGDWLKSKPENRAIVWTEPKREFGAGNVKALTRNIGDESNPWRITTYWDRNGRLMPAGHQVYKTRLDALAEDKPMKGSIFSEELPSDVMTEKEISGWKDMSEVDDPSKLVWYKTKDTAEGLTFKLRGTADIEKFVRDSFQNGRIAFTEAVDPATEKYLKLEREKPSGLPQNGNRLSPAKASQEFDRLIVEQGLQLDWIDKPDALFAEIGKALDTASIKAKLAKGKALQAARRKAAGDLGLKPDDVDTVAGRAKALDVLKKHIEERNAPDTSPETGNEDTSFLPEEKPAQVIPKLRPGEKGTGDLLQGEDAPFNLAGETAVDTERVAREKADAAKKAAEAKAAQEKQQPGLTGIGGAVPGEFEGENNFVSNMFAAIDRDRAQMGKEPMLDTQRRSWDEDNQKALARMNRNPQWIPDLITEVTKSPRPLLSWENAGMVWQRHLWKAEANNALARIAQAFDDGRTADLESAKLDAARYEEKLEALDKAVGRNGTGSEAGRSLQAQKMAGGEDFTLVEMRLEARKSLGGRPLTEAESAEIKTLHDKLARNEIDITAARGRIAQLEMDKAAAEARAQPSYSPGVLEQAERFVKKLESGAEDSAKWLREHMGRTSAAVDPTVLYHVTKLGAAKFARGAIELAKWTDAMAAEVGEWVREKAQDWFEASKKLHDEQLGLIEKAQGKVFADKVKKAVTDIPGRIDAAKASIKGKVDKGTTAIAGDVQKLFKAVVEQNPTMKARELADVMHGILKESMPDITWQETIDAISGRGKFWRPSQEVMAKKLRDLRQQLRLIGHEIDVEEKRPLPRTGMQRDPMSAEALAENKRLSELKRKFGVVVTDPKTQLTGTTVHSALRARKTAIAREIAELQDRIAKSDFGAKPKRTIVPDSQLTTLQTQKARLVKEFRQKLLANEMANRSRGRRVADLLLRIRREFILSGISSIGKLFSYSAQEFALAPPKEAAGAVLSKMPGISQIAERAPSEVAHRGLGSEVKGMINDYVAAFTKGIKDAKDTWATGESELKARLDPAIRPEAEFRAFFGTLHQMEKSPLIRFGFERSFRRRMESAADRGLDVSDVGVQQRIAVDAYQDALRGALINRNAVVNRVNRFITSLEEKSKTTGRTPALATAAKFAFSSELPVQHVPANYVARTAEYIFGLGTGSVKAAMAFRRGIETLQPAEADQIMRHLKSGSVGSAAMLAGFLLPKLFGGLWTPGGKKNDQLKPGEIQAGPVKVRYWATHEQVLNAAQFGATVRKISETKHQGLSAGAQAALWGLADEVPYARELSDFAKAKDPRMAGKFWEEKAKGYLIPQGVSQLAELLDMNEQWRTVKRTPHNVGQALESGIPGLRQSVPTH